MKKGLILFVFLAVILLLSYFVFFKSSESPTGNVLLDGNKANDSNPNKNNNNIKNGSTEATDKDMTVGSKGGSEGSGSSGGESGSTGGEETSEPETAQIPMCMLVRPGNLPDIGCFVSSITREGVSLNLKNELGENIGVEISLNSCDQKKETILENNEIKNFMFNCELTEDYFNKEVSIAYILSDNKRVEISGFISGPVNQ